MPTAASAWPPWPCSAWRARDENGKPICRQDAKSAKEKGNEPQRRRGAKGTQKNGGRHFSGQTECLVFEFLRAFAPLWFKWGLGMKARVLPADEFLLLALALVVAPHAVHLQPWVVPLAAVMGLWRWAAGRGRAGLPGKWFLAAMAVSALAGILLSHGTLFGRDAGVALLTLLGGLKLLELRGYRDALILVFLGYFRVATTFSFPSWCHRRLHAGGHPGHDDGAGGHGSSRRRTPLARPSAPGGPDAGPGGAGDGGAVRSFPPPARPPVGHARRFPQQHDRAVGRNVPRQHQPVVPVECGGLPGWSSRAPIAQDTPPSTGGGR